MPVASSALVPAAAGSSSSCTQLIPSPPNHASIHFPPPLTLDSGASVADHIANLFAEVDALQCMVDDMEKQPTRQRRQARLTGSDSGSDIATALLMPPDEAHKQVKMMEESGVNHPVVQHSRARTLSVVTIMPPPESESETCSLELIDTDTENDNDSEADDEYEETSFDSTTTNVSSSSTVSRKSPRSSPPFVSLHTATESRHAAYSLSDASSTSTDSDQSTANIINKHCTPQLLSTLHTFGSSFSTPPSSLPDFLDQVATTVSELHKRDHESQAQIQHLKTALKEREAETKCLRESVTEKDKALQEGQKIIDTFKRQIEELSKEFKCGNADAIQPQMPASHSQTHTPSDASSDRSDSSPRQISKSSSFPHANFFSNLHSYILQLLRTIQHQSRRIQELERQLWESEEVGKVNEAKAKMWRQEQLRRRDLEDQVEQLNEQLRMYKQNEKEMKQSRMEQIQMNQCERVDSGCKDARMESLPAQEQLYVRLKELTADVEGLKSCLVIPPSQLPPELLGKPRPLITTDTPSAGQRIRKFHSIASLAQSGSPTTTKLDVNELLMKQAEIHEQNRIRAAQTMQRPSSSSRRTHRSSVGLRSPNSAFSQRSQPE